MNLAVKEQLDTNQVSKDTKMILETLTQLENHTAELRKKLMAELKQKNNSLKLTLDLV